MATLPSAAGVAAAVRDFQKSDLNLAERAVALVFSQWPLNSQLEQVLAKVTILNALYSTSIYDVKSVARHITFLNIDERLTRGDLQLVNDIATIKFKEKTRHNLSFASKYCSWHQPEIYQIYDSYVDRLLREYQVQIGAPKYKSNEFKNYSRFLEVIENLRVTHGLTQVSRKELDQFLWLEGRKLVSPPES